MTSELRGSVTDPRAPDWLYEFAGVRVFERPNPCPWPYKVTRLDTGESLILRLHHRKVTHRPSGDWLELTWSAHAPLERPHTWHSQSGSRDTERLRDAFVFLARFGSSGRGRPRNTGVIADLKRWRAPTWSSRR